MAAPQTQSLHGRLVDTALWATSAGLTLLTLLFSFGLRAPGSGSLALADKLGHGAMYFATFLCFLLAAVWRPGRGDGPFPTKAPLFALGLVIAGIVIEVLQGVAIAGRHAEVGDVGAEPLEPSARSRSTRGCGAGGLPPNGCLAPRRTIGRVGEWTTRVPR